MNSVVEACPEHAEHGSRCVKAKAICAYFTYFFWLWSMTSWCKLVDCYHILQCLQTIPHLLEPRIQFIYFQCCLNGSLPHRRVFQRCFCLGDRWFGRRAWSSLIGHAGSTTRHNAHIFNVEQSQIAVSLQHSLARRCVADHMRWIHVGPCDRSSSWIANSVSWLCIAMPESKREQNLKITMYKLPPWGSLSMISWVLDFMNHSRPWFHCVTTTPEFVRWKRARTQNIILFPATLKPNISANNSLVILCLCRLILLA